MTILYHVPAALAEVYRGRPLIVRARAVAELTAALAKVDRDNVVYVQWFALPAGLEALTRWPEPIPLDLKLARPGADYPLLYRATALLAHCPVRVSLPVVPGFGKAVRLAVSLQFAVKLELGQPDPALVRELHEVLDRYLHQTTVAQPVEFFHSSLLALVHQRPASLWTIQEEDPAAFRYVTDAGEETLPGRLAGASAPGDPGVFLTTWREELLTAQSECADCPFFDQCGGYFKWPDCAYPCAGVKTLFHTLHEAAAELRRDLAAASAP